MALFSAASYQSQSLPTNVQLSVFCSFTIKIGTISYDGSTDNGIVCQLRITHLLCISQNHRNLQAMLSKSFCSLNQEVSRKTTCSGLFVLRLKDLNANDFEHGFIIYALYQNTSTPNQCRVNCSPLYERGLVQDSCNFGFSTLS